MENTADSVRRAPSLPWRSTSLLALLGVVVTGAGLGAASCGGGDSPSGTSSSGSGGGSGTSGSGGSGGGAATSFTPQGCAFSIAGRPEYLGFSLGQAIVGPAPDLRRVRLGLGGNVVAGAAGHADPATSIAFAWQSNEGTLASEAQWGNDPDPTKWPAENRASGVTWATPASTLNAPADERMHEVYLCGLSPAKTYYYRVGGGPAGAEVWSDVYSFTTAPSDPAAPVLFGVTGDSRGEEQDAWRLIQRRLKVAGVGMQLFSGDVINLAPDQGEWEQWLDSAWKDTDKTPLTLASILTLSAHGNHENHTSLFFGNLTLPQDLAKYPKYAELFYSVDVGPVHVVVLDDAWIVNPPDDPDYQPALTEWLTADLDAAVKNRAKVPWIVTVNHHSAFSSANHGSDTDVLLGREYFVPMWDKYHVDLAIGGHDHNYERTKPITGPAKTPTLHTEAKDGTVYVVCAGSGADSYNPSTSNFTELSHGYDNSTVLGLYGILAVTQTTLKLEAHDLRPDGSDPIFDTLTITK
jgi:purple acid phosphatase-like protein/calcineurin-like phosphoesterase family protein